MTKKLNLQITCVNKMCLIFNLYNLKLNKTSLYQRKNFSLCINGKTNIILCNLIIKIQYIFLDFQKLHQNIEYINLPTKKY